MKNLLPLICLVAGAAVYSRHGWSSVAVSVIFLFVAFAAIDRVYRRRS